MYVDMLKRAAELRDQITHVNADLMALETKRCGLSHALADHYERMADWHRDQMGGGDNGATQEGAIQDRQRAIAAA